MPQKSYIRRVVNGLVYDTDTAEHVVEIDRGLRASRDGYELCSHAVDGERTDLYRSKKGQFFMAGMVNVAKNGYLNDFKGVVTLLSPVEARALTEKYHGPVEDYFTVQEG